MFQVPPLHPTGWALALAGTLDGLTMLALPVGSELNPLAAAHPGIALVAKAALTVWLIGYHGRYATSLRAFGAIAWTVGFLSNALVIGGNP